MKKYGIIGGTFDPIHNAHLYIAYEAKELLGLDKVIFIPNGSPPHKDNKNITGASLRYRMVLEAIKDFEDFEVSKYEIEKKELSYTYKTLEHFKEDDVLDNTNLQLKSKIIFLNILDLEISSTDIRKRISEGKRIDFFVPKRVINLIEKENIYNERN